MAKERNFFDDAKRYGFMNKGKGCPCKSCSVSISATDARLFDNHTMLGPYCMACVRREAHGEQHSISESPDLSDVLARLAAIESRVSKLEALYEEEVQTLTDEQQAQAKAQAAAIQAEHSAMIKARTRAAIEEHSTKTKQAF